jgi:arylsulfatase A-like enzyme
VPILFWRPGSSGTAVEQPAQVVDILPTLAAMIGLNVPPGSIDGHCLAAATQCPSEALEVRH